MQQLMCMIEVIEIDIYCLFIRFNNTSLSYMHYACINHKCASASIMVMQKKNIAFFVFL